MQQASWKSPHKDWQKVQGRRWSHKILPHPKERHEELVTKYGTREQFSCFLDNPNPDALTIPVSGKTTAMDWMCNRLPPSTLATWSRDWTLGLQLMALFWELVGPLGTRGLAGEWRPLRWDHPSTSDPVLSVFWFSMCKQAHCKLPPAVHSTKPSHQNGGYPLKSWAKSNCYFPWVALWLLCHSD